VQVAAISAHSIDIQTTASRYATPVSPVSDANGPNSIVRATELVAGSTARRALFRRYPQPATVEGEPPRVRLQRHLGQLLQRERIEPYDFRDDVMSNPQRPVPRGQRPRKPLDVHRHRLVAVDVDAGETLVVGRH
jgi:hypothetical protein